VQEEADHYMLTGPLSPLAIPTTLQDSLMARLDRLAPAKEVAQVGAAIGREFSYALLRSVTPLDDSSLQDALARLVDAAVLYQHGVASQTRYVFKHALIQETAYQSLLRSRRQQYHHKIAQVLEADFPDIVETQPEVLAHHYTEAGLSAQAISHWQRAGQRALGRSANLEAIAHLTKGLEVLNTLPDSLERTRQELGVQTTLGPALIATQGFAAAAVEQTYARARELCERVEQTPQLSRVLTGLAMFYLMRGELQTARELAEQLLRLAERVHDPELRLLATTGQGSTLFLLGELGAARAHLEQGMALYDPQHHRTHALLYGLDHGVSAFSHAAQTLWLLGYPDQALRRSEEALTLAQGLAHLFSRALTMIMGADVHRLRREWPLAQERAEAALTLSTEQGFALWVARGTMLRGWALAAQGQGEAGIVHMHRGLAAYQATGAKRGQPAFLALLAEAYGNVGRIEAGLLVLAEALAIVRTTGECWGEAELYRLKGELLLLQATGRGGPDKAPIDPSRVAEAEVGATGRLPLRAEAEACFRQALTIARHQQAKSWELRAAMSLARLWQQQGKRTAAHDLLAPVYGWFTEGFDTADLQEARALLEALEEGPS
jgi:predicted ATPase